MCSCTHKGLLPIPAVVRSDNSWKINYSCCVLFCNNKFTLCLLNAATKNSYLMHVDFHIMTSSRRYPLFIASICQIMPVTLHTLKGEIPYPKDIFYDTPMNFHVWNARSTALLCSRVSLPLRKAYLYPSMHIGLTANRVRSLAHLL